MANIRYSFALILFCAVASVSATNDWEDLTKSDSSSPNSPYTNSINRWVRKNAFKLFDEVDKIRVSLNSATSSETPVNPVQSTPAQTVTTHMTEVVKEVATKATEVVEQAQSTVAEITTQISEKVASVVKEVGQDAAQKIQRVTGSETPVVTSQDAASWLDTNALIELVHAKFNGAHVWAVEHKQLLIKCGVGAAALVTIGGTTYVLYRNGTLTSLADACKKHSTITTAAVGASIIGTVAGAYIYYKGAPLFVSEYAKSVKAAFDSCAEFVIALPAQVGLAA